VHDSRRHKDAVPRTQNALLLLDPVLKRARDHIDEFFLVGVIVEVVPRTREEGPFDDP
jgi:hypothetical protein